MSGDQHDLLGRCAAAFERRGKAIWFRTVAFSIERETEPDGEERLSIGAHTAHRTRVRLSLWPDGALWFLTARPGTRRRGGWDFLVMFHGTLGELPPGDLVETFEASLHGLHPMHGDVGESATSRMLALWSRVQPIVG